ncbi:phage portal protein [Glaesserella parasuis]|uniref:phage portal protein n=1 Tax=Glaesserella parasuis TaxID=738 RepID=UPI00243725BE|nr:phage portal protein [Glaesserella parasuis]MDG6816584.1 phage portal protein [Glaesserella parasuis]
MKIEQFTFGDPTPVLDNADILNYFESVLMYEKYYNPPVDFSGLARAVKSSAHHQSALAVKKNILMSTCQTSPLLPRYELEKVVQDYLIFGNAYLEKRMGKEKQILGLNAPLAKYVRRGREQDKFFLLANGYQEYEFPSDSVFHLKQPDVNQEIYGLPDYLASLQSAFLNESATLFRRKYYLNGAHAGSIIYMTDPMASETDVDDLKEQLQQAKGKGNFKNLFLYAPDGKENGIKVIPLSDVVAKDEFLNIKNTSRDDILAAHRVPPQLMGIIPNNTGGFGDIEKAGKVFFINEILPLQQRLAEINQWLGKEVITFKPYILLEQ